MLDGSLEMGNTTDQIRLGEANIHLSVYLRDGSVVMPGLRAPNILFPRIVFEQLS